MISAPWYEDKVEQLAFNLYAMHESAVEDCIKALATVEDIEDEDAQEQIFDHFGLFNITETEKQRILAEAEKLRW